MSDSSKTQIRGKLLEQAGDAPAALSFPALEGRGLSRNLVN
jgi:hypothetical protein